MRRFVFILACLFVFTSSLISFHQASAATGEEIFQSLGCGSCHKPEKKATGVSLSTISTKYKSQDNLVKFFRGENKPVIEDELPMMMKGQMGKIGALPDDEKKALAEYIFGSK